MQCARPLITGRFVLLVVFTMANIVLDILSHFWLVEVTVDHFHGFIHAHIAVHLAVMFGFHYFQTERRITCDPDLAFAEEYSIFVCN